MLGEIEPLGWEAYWFMTTPQGKLVIVIREPTVPGEKIRIDLGNMRFGLVWGYKFVDESGYPGWPIHWKLVGGPELPPSPIATMDDDVTTGDDETGKYALMLLPGDYEILEDV